MSGKAFAIIFVFCGITVTNCTNFRKNGKVKSEAVGGLDYYMGEVSKRDTVKHTFVIKNTGFAPLLIDSVSTSCGCINSNWQKKPVMPGATGDINVAIAADTRFKGKIRQYVVVRTNAENPLTVFNILYIVK